MQDTWKKFHRLAPDREVRLRYAYFIKLASVVKDENSEVTEVHCTYDPAGRQFARCRKVMAPSTGSPPTTQ